MAIAGFPEEPCMHGHDPGSWRPCRRCEVETEVSLVTILLFLGLAVEAGVIFWFFPSALGWAAGISMILVGGIYFYFWFRYRQVSILETQMIKQNPGLSSDYSKAWPVPDEAEVKDDLALSNWWMTVSAVVLLVGIGLTLFMISD